MVRAATTQRTIDLNCADTVCTIRQEGDMDNINKDSGDLKELFEKSRAIIETARKLTGTVANQEHSTTPPHFHPAFSTQGSSTLPIS